MGSQGRTWLSMRTHTHIIIYMRTHTHIIIYRWTYIYKLIGIFLILIVIYIFKKDQSNTEYTCLLSHFSHVWLCDLPDSSVRGISRQGSWSGLPFPPPGGLPDPKIEPTSLTLQTDSLLSEPPGKENNTGDY